VTNVTREVYNFLSRDGLNPFPFCIVYILLEKKLLPQPRCTI
jgi:hypothetical protein